jgi:alpha-1,3-mannosyl-glycoprotein beta-1,2-N-acetylglucosaminyltransferase
MTTTITGSVSTLSSSFPNTIHRSANKNGYLRPFESPLLIFTCKRAEYLQQTLDDVLKYLPARVCTMGCPIIISQDGTAQAVKDVVVSYKLKFAERQIPLVHLQHKTTTQHVRRGKLNPYQALAVHYGWALQQVFSGEATHAPEAPMPQRVVILEEDLHIAPDFFGYFERTAELLDDTSQNLLAVSAFNDNGAHVLDPRRIVRSDFFPGLGWMMPRWLWDNELSGKWPEGYWDDWLRDPAQRQGRNILRPEISRTFHFGTKGGASSNQFGSLLTEIRLNDILVDWSQEDLSYLLNGAFDASYRKLVDEATLATDLDGALKKVKESNTRLEYGSFPEFQRLARKLKLMDDEKAGVPRTAYKGIVETRPHDNFLLFLVPRAEAAKVS